MYTDPIADMLTRIKNAVQARKAELVLPYSKFKAHLAELLKQEGFISGHAELIGEHKVLQINLKYGPKGEPVISGIRRVSKPGQRIYLPADRLPRTNSGYGITVVSTSKGLLTDAQARKAKVGGEIVCQVW
ncbi:MAG: 30S ribosomal protein S8 [Patescibacteria group bacterium]|nr:30S ribosomal protein S8 [Patescibacteria group bacterium]